MRHAERLLCIAWLVCAALAGARAEEGPLERRIEQLEERLHALEAERAAGEAHPAEAASEAASEPASAPASEPGPQPAPEAASLLGRSLAEWQQHVRLGGSANTGYFQGQNDSVIGDPDFRIWDARFFVDAELGEDVRVAGTSLVRNAGLSFEWNLVRLGDLQNDVGDLYVELQGLLGSSWANVQVGRFQIPVGEAYLRYGRGVPDNPFVSNPVGGPWFWDEGVKLYGASRGGRVGYVASLTDGENPFGAVESDPDADKQVSLRLYARPTSWLYVSLSGLRSGRLGSKTQNAAGSLWLGESWARAFGAGSNVPSFVDGAPVADGPSRLDDSWLAAVDVIAQRPDLGRLWLAYGAYHIDSRGPGLYDRTLHYWIAELLVEGRALWDPLAPFYLGARGHGLGTYDSDRGYLLDFRYADSLGYNMQAIDALSLVLGWRLTRWLALRAEWTYADIDLVRGVPGALRRAARDADAFAIELGAHF